MQPLLHWADVSRHPTQAEPQSTSFLQPQFWIRRPGKSRFPHLTIPAPPSSFPLARESIDQPVIRKSGCSGADECSAVKGLWRLSGVGMDSRLRGIDGIGTGTDCSWGEGIPGGRLNQALADCGSSPPTAKAGKPQQRTTAGFPLPSSRQASPSPKPEGKVISLWSPYPELGFLQQEAPQNATQVRHKVENLLAKRKDWRPITTATTAMHPSSALPSSWPLPESSGYES